MDETLGKYLEGAKACVQHLRIVEPPPRSPWSGGLGARPTPAGRARDSGELPLACGRQGRARARLVRAPELCNDARDEDLICGLNYLCRYLDQKGLGAMATQPGVFRGAHWNAVAPVRFTAS